MILLKPNNISGEIMTLMDEAKEKVIIVSPYYRVDKWYKLLNKLDILKERKIPVEFYVRKDEVDSIHQLENAGFNPIQVPNLHAKLYLNEKTAILTSMNLHHGSEIKSIEFGYKTTEPSEYSEIWDCYLTYIKRDADIQKERMDWRKQLLDVLTDSCGRAYLYEEERTIRIRTKKNNYSTYIWLDEGKNLLRMSGILSTKECDYSRARILEIENRTGLSIEIYEGNNGYYPMIYGTLKNTPLGTYVINKIDNGEHELIMNSLAKFIKEVEDIKTSAYKKSSSLL